MRKLVSLLLSLATLLGTLLPTYANDLESKAIKKIDASSTHAALVTEDGYLYTVGDNTYGQLGLGHNISQTNFTKVDIDNVKDVTTAWQYCTFVIKNDGSLWGSGNNGNGVLGLGATTSSTPTFTYLGLDNVKKVVSHYQSTLALLEDGTVYATGYDYEGNMMGIGTCTYSFTKLNIDNVKDISVGGSGSSLFLKNDGTLWAIGTCVYGNIGEFSGTLSDYTQVAIEDVESVLTVQGCTFLFKKDGSTWVSGWNHIGVLGLGDASYRYKFEECPLDNIKQVDISGTSSMYNTLGILLLKTDGTVWSLWGHYYNNAYVTTGTDYRYAQLNVGKAVQIARGYTYSLILQEDGKLLCYSTTSGVFEEVDLPFNTLPPTLSDDATSNSKAEISNITKTVNDGNVVVGVATNGVAGDLEYGLNNKWQESNEFNITESGEYTIGIKEKTEVDTLDEVTINVDLDSNTDGLNILNKESKLVVGSTLQVKTETIKLTKEMGISLFNDEGLTYESSNPKVASVDENGKVKALKQGKVTVTVSLNDLTDTLTLEVLPITGTVENNGDIIINGEIQALVMSLTVPQAVDFVINPNTRVEGETFISPKFYITNNSALDIGVTVEKLAVAEDSDYKFTDVDKDTFTEEEWYRLSPTNSMKYLALRIVPQDKTEWVNQTTRECQAIETNVKLGIIPSYQSSSLKLEANHGTALQPVTCKYNTVFVFEIDNLVE